MGSGNTTYNIVDREVQRDPVSKLPVMHSSGLKGSFREHFENRYDSKDSNGNTIISEEVKSIFGSSKEAGTGNNDQAQNPGSHLFFGGQLWAIPVRSNKKPYFLATAPFVLRAFLEYMDLYGVDDNTGLVDAIKDLPTSGPTEGKPWILDDLSEVKLEDYLWTAEPNKQELNKLNAVLQQAGLVKDNNLALLHDDDFKELCANLPVIARNNLENGISQNLWYEEVVPRESLFYSFVARGDEEYKLFDTQHWDRSILQVGANATIGYGQCLLLNDSLQPIKQ